MEGSLEGRRLWLGSIIFAPVVVALLWFYPYGLNWWLGVAVFGLGNSLAVKGIDRLVDRLGVFAKAS